MQQTVQALVNACNISDTLSTTPKAHTSNVKNHCVVYRSYEKPYTAGGWRCGCVLLRLLLDVASSRRLTACCAAQLTEGRAMPGCVWLYCDCRVGTWGWA